ncbi:MAG: CBS domain-containing protein, partial [Chloroflexi bacterium]|nr:CBS domain-containing protein [Chloroflexota bacterium]
MTKNVITVTPDCTIRELKELMRVKRLSGVPVVSQGELVGIISMENLIKALERGELSSTVGAKMTRQVQSVRSDE